MSREQQLEEAREFLQRVKPLFLSNGLTPFAEWHRNKYLIKARITGTTYPVIHVATVEAMKKMSEYECIDRIKKCARSLENEI